ncbi:MAG: hypothetical protein Q7S06_00615 [Nanoarchaeota archaeon]|nr:hypothetical protein [Nanoarchaeota archaeon]
MNEEKLFKLLEEFNRKLDGLIILESVDRLTNEDKLKILRYSVGIKTAAKILEKDASNFKKTIKKEGKNAKTKKPRN